MLRFLNWLKRLFTRRPARRVLRDEDITREPFDDGGAEEWTPLIWLDYFHEGYFTDPEPLIDPPDPEPDPDQLNRDVARESHG